MKALQKVAITLLTIATGAITLCAQNTAMSPYTRYGYGNLSDNATSAQRSMGGIGYAMNSGRQINVMNPASYAAMDSLTFLFDMGIDFTSLWSSEGSTSEQQFGGGLDYITMQVPIMRGLGASVGVLPWSSVGYAFGNSIDNGHASREGSGSINQLYLGVGGSPVKGLGIGFNIAYLFGSTSNALYASSVTGSTTLFERTITIRDWRMDIGAQYTLRLNPSNVVTVGLTYSPAKNLHGHTYGIYYDSSSQPIVPDTVNVGDTKLNGRYSTPERWGAGINWKWANRLMVEGDITYEPWSKAKYGTLQNFEDSRFVNRYRAALGAEYTPHIRGSYFQRMNYRLGVFADRDYIVVRNNTVRQYGVSMGFGFPVPGFKTIINLGIEYRHRQAHPTPLIKENYLNITLGVNFNEMWFRKNRIY